MAENNTDRTSRFGSDSTHSPPTPTPSPPSPSTFPCKNPDEEEDTDTARETKRRKICPTTLDKIEELSTFNGNFSFTFDTKFIPCAPEITPKFGSFNQVVSETEIMDRLSRNSKDEEGSSREPEQQQSGVLELEDRNGVVVSELGKI